ncbi:MAG: hypothetical protein FWG03_08055 [Clostridiales bacterium]|nr:hypothetical protein [Clostridiales bacterium]
MDPKNRFIRHMLFQGVDRAPFMEIGPWGQTADRWVAEGLPLFADPLNMFVGGNAYFGLEGIDVVGIDLLPPYPRREEELIHEDERYVVFLDEFGRKRKALKEGTAHGTRLSMDHYSDFPVKCRADFETYKQGYSSETIDARYGPDWESIKKEALESEKPLHLLDPMTGTFGFYSMLRNFMGTEHLSYMLYDDRALVEESLEMLCEYAIQAFKRALDEIGFDFYIMHEDMCYKSGPLISPRMFQELFLPRYKRFIGFLKANGVKQVMMDTDGNYLQLLPHFLEAGIDSITPNECAAGMDVVELRRQYPGLGLMGGIDKRALTQGKDAIRRELEYKIGSILDKGGYIPTIDHSIPPDVSLGAFEYYLEVKRRLVFGG